MFIGLSDDLHLDSFRQCIGITYVPRVVVDALTSKDTCFRSCYEFEDLTINYTYDKKFSSMYFSPIKCSLFW